MYRKKNPLAKQRGFLMVVAVFLIVVVGFLGIVMSYMLFGSSTSTINGLQSDQAFYLAEAGIEHATHLLLTSTLTNRTACSGLSLNYTLGAGAYAATTSGPSYVSSPTTLNGTLSAAATTIPVVSTAGYSSSGRIMIDSELINYAAADATDFLGAERGVDNSIAATHVSGTYIGQYQCGLSVKGGVPSLTAPADPGYPGEKRLLLADVQLQAAWAVGRVLAGNSAIFQWNYPTEVNWNHSSINYSDSLYGVFVLSYADAWAVGADSHLLHWNGNRVTLMTVSPTTTYRGIFCSASNDCHAVGHQADGNQDIIDWHGARWVRTLAIGLTQANNLFSVHCDASNDCWAVGDGRVFYHWSGSAPWVGYRESLTAYPYRGVFCNAADDCWAVGANASFARLTGGTTWYNYATGLPAAHYHSIFCNSTSDCWAVGNTNANRDLFVHWNGVAWSRDPSNPRPSANLISVACTGQNDCWAVGRQSTFVHWDGASWTQFATNLSSSVNLKSVSIVGAHSRPLSAWSEYYP